MSHLYTDRIIVGRAETLVVRRTLQGKKFYGYRNGKKLPLAGATAGFPNGDRKGGQTLYIAARIAMPLQPLLWGHVIQRAHVWLALDNVQSIYFDRLLSPHKFDEIEVDWYITYDEHDFWANFPYGRIVLRNVTD